MRGVRRLQYWLGLGYALARILRISPLVSYKPYPYDAVIPCRDKICCAVIFQEQSELCPVIDLLVLV